MKKEATGRKAHICAIKNALKVGCGCDKILFPSPKLLKLVFDSDLTNREDADYTFAREEYQ